METSVKKEIDFDFYGKKQNQERKDLLKSRTEKYLQFKKMGLIACGSVLAITLAGFSGKAVYDSVQASTDKAIAEKEMIIKSVPKTQIIELIERERDVVKSSYAKNQILLNGYANYKELVQMLNLNSSVASKSNANKKLEKDTLTLLDADQKSIDKVVYAMSASRDVKKEVFLNRPDMEKYSKWVSNVQNKQFMYAGGIISLNKDLNKELKFLDDTQKDIVQTVKDKIKAKDFSLDKAQNELTSQLSKDAKAEIDELKKVQSEIAGTDQKDLLTDKDIAQAQDAMTDIQKEAALKIKQDRETVEKMIASANTAPAAPVQVNGQNNQQYNNQNNQGNYNNNSNHWGFAEYYLLYSWMNSGSSNYNSSQNYNSGYNAGVAAQQNASRATTSAILARGSSGLYNIRTPDSYINKSMDRKPIPTVNGASSSATRIERPNPSLLRAKMDLAKSKAQQATVARKADITKKAEVARKTEQAKSSSSSNSNSSSKPSSFGNSASKSSSGSSSYKSSGSSSRSSSTSSRRK